VAGSRYVSAELIMLAKEPCEEETGEEGGDGGVGREGTGGGAE
jgi:hypothetical protein